MKKRFSDYMWVLETIYLMTMILYKPRSWCAYCPMGTMTQGICKLKYRKDEKINGGKS